MKIDTSERKKFRIRNKLKKVSSFDRFRLSIFRSTKNISAQIIDDNKNITLLSVSSTEPSEIIAKASSVDGSITSKLLGFTGETHLPFI